MKKSVKISLIVLIVFVIAVAATLGCLVLTELYKKRDVRGTPFEGLYSLDECSCTVRKQATENKR